MDWIPVKSSNIEAVAWDRETKTLSVKFLNGGIYHYKDVPSYFFYELKEAHSPGKYFFEFIKGKFEFVKEEPKKEEERSL
jgi:hypothetical protein